MIVADYYQQLLAEVEAAKRARASATVAALAATARTQAAPSASRPSERSRELYNFIPDHRAFTSKHAPYGGTVPSARRRPACASPAGKRALPLASQLKQ
eukprot:4826387-Pleurochrysis_carterae.AAC.13